MNIDAATKNEKNALALIARDSRGKAILVASKTFCAIPLEMAKGLALSWATELIMAKGWEWVEWASDAQKVVKIITSSCNGIVSKELEAVKHRISLKRWTLRWTPREANKAADLIASLSLSFSINFN